MSEKKQEKDLSKEVDLILPQAEKLVQVGPHNP
jgi:hypothetical protein